MEQTRTQASAALEAVERGEWRASVSAYLAGELPGGDEQADLLRVECALYLQRADEAEEILPSLPGGARRAMLEAEALIVGDSYGDALEAFGLARVAAEADGDDLTGLRSSLGEARALLRLGRREESMALATDVEIVAIAHANDWIAGVARYV